MSVLLAFLMLNLGAVQIYKKLKMPPVLSHITVLSSSVMMLWLGGLLNVIAYVLALIIILIFGFTLFDVFKNGFKSYVQKIKDYCDLPTILNALTGAVFTVIYTIQNPLFYYWDEYSFWGSAAKILKESNHLYTNTDASLEWLRIIPPGTTNLTYLFSAFTSQFKPYHLYLAYALLYFAVFALAAHLINKKFHKPYIGITCFFALVLSPFLSLYHLPSLDFTSVSYAYATSMVDFMLAVVTAGVVFTYLCKPKAYWYIIHAAFLVTLKEIGLIFALMAIAIIAILQIFDKTVYTEKRTKKEIGKQIFALICSVVLCLGIYIAWSSYLLVPRNYVYKNTDTSQNLIRNKDLRNTFQEEVVEATPAPTEPAPTVEAPPTVEEADEPSPTLSSLITYSYKTFIYSKLKSAYEIVESVVVPEKRSESFQNVLTQMQYSFFNEKSTPLGKDTVLVFALIAIGAVGIIFADKKQRLAYILLNVFLTVCAYLYSFFISYFMAGFGDGMVEYGRYMSSYYFAWGFIVIVFTLLAFHKKELLAGIFALSFALFGATSLYNLKLEHTAIAAPDNAYVIPKKHEENIEKYKDILTKDDRVYLVYDALNVYPYMTYRYYLYPTLLNLDTNNTGIDFSNGFRIKSKFTHDDKYYTLASKEQFATIMAQNFEYILLDKFDKIFVQDYGELFEDELQPGTLYKIEKGDKISFKAVNP